MFDLEYAITEWRRQMLAAGIKAPVPLDELEAHLRDHIDRLKAGVSEEEAFHSATQQLGNSEILKQEFSKVKRHRFWILLGSPLALKIIAVWFVVMGLESLRLFMRPLYWDLKGLWPSLHLASLNLNWLLNWFLWFFILMGCLHIFIGIGLIRRQNGWRVAALVMAFYKMCRIPFFIYNICFHYETWFAPSIVFEFMGFRLPLVFTYIFPVINFTMAFWAVYLLTKSTVRKQFRPATAN